MFLFHEDDMFLWWLLVGTTVAPILFQKGMAAATSTSSPHTGSETIVAVASFGYHAVLVQSFGSFIPPSRLVSPGCLRGGQDGIIPDSDDSKNEMIRSLMTQEKITDLSSVLLVDDSWYHIMRFREWGGNVFHVKGEKGLTMDMWMFVYSTYLRPSMSSSPETTTPVKMVVFDADLTLFSEHVTCTMIYPYLEETLETEEEVDGKEDDTETMIQRKKEKVSEMASSVDWTQYWSPAVPLLRSFLLKEKRD